MKDSFNNKRKSIYLGSLFVLIGVLTNEWLIAKYFTSDGVLENPEILNTIRIINIIFLTIGFILIFKPKIDFQNIFSIVFYLFYLLLVIIVFDTVILHNFLGYGYPRNFQEEYHQRYPAPYVEFIGKPENGTHNEYGFLGPSFVEAKPNDLKIAFFGGSTGYLGNPPIPNVVEKELENLLDRSVFIANYSVVASNHRQHLHGLIEYLPEHKPDLVIFYGGYNETIQSANYDPRPGYPYNFFYRAETNSFLKLLLENSAIIGEIDKRTGKFTNLAKLRTEQQPFSDDWNKRIADKYFETLMLANNVTGTIESDLFGETIFFAFYQPYKVPKEFKSTHKDIKNRINMIEYVFDVSNEYDDFRKEAYFDDAHVTQRARNVMGLKIARIVAEKLQDRNLFIEKE